MLLRGWARRSAPLPPQVYSLVVVLPRTPLKERISLPCERPGGAARGGGVAVGTPLGLVHWKRASSPVEAGTAGYL